jgi:hypothetical protein
LTDLSTSLVGGIELSLGLVSASGGAWLLSGRIARSESLATRVTVAGLLGVGGVVGISLICGSLGILYAPVVAAVITVTSVSLFVLTRSPGALPPPERTRPSRTVGAAALAGVFTFATIVAVAVCSGPHPTDSDDVTYHIPNAAFWSRAHDLWHLPAVLPGYFTNGYPSDSELITTWLVQPFQSARLAGWTTLFFGVILVSGVVFVAEQLGVRARTGAVASAAVLLSPLSWQTQIHSALTDWASAAGLIAGVGFALRARSGEMVWVLLCGLSVGLAVGTKDTAFLPGVLVVGFALLLLPRGKRVRAVGNLAIGVVSLAGFWYLRNWIDTGNPVYPETIRLGPLTTFAGGRSPLTAYSNSLASDLIHARGGVLSTWLHLVRLLLGPVALVPLAGAAGVALVRRRRSVGATAAMVVLFFVAYLVTPYTGPNVEFLVSSQLRYAFPAIFLGAAVAGAFGVWAEAIAWIGVGFDALHIWRGSNFNPDVNATSSVLLLALGCGLIVATACFVPHLSPGRVAMAAGRWSEPLLVFPATTAVVFVAVAILASRPIGANPVDRLLDASGVRCDRIAVIGDTDVLSALGPHLCRPQVSAGTGRAGEEISPTPGQLARVLGRTGAKAVLVGPPGTVGVSPSWSLPPTYRFIGRVGLDRIVVLIGGTRSH